MTAAPGQAPEVYRRWLRIDQPANWDGPSDGLTEELWHEKSDAQKRFWRDLDDAAQPQPAPGDRAFRSDLVDAMLRWSGRDRADVDECASELAAILDRHPMAAVQQPQPAPGAELEDAYAAAHGRITELEAERDGAYRERAALVAHLAACYPSVMLADSAEPDWPIVFVSTPAGQLSWHIAATDTDLFQHVPSTTEPTWDGHTTEVKYARLAGLVRNVAAGRKQPAPEPDAAASPELAAAMAETRKLREIIAELLGEFRDPGATFAGKQTRDRVAHLTGAQVERLRERAGLPS